MLESQLQRLRAATGARSTAPVFHHLLWPHHSATPLPLLRSCVSASESEVTFFRNLPVTDGLERVAPQVVQSKSIYLSASTRRPNKSLTPPPPPKKASPYFKQHSDLN